MRTLVGWIVGVFALGLAVGSLYRSATAESEPEDQKLESVLRSAPAVDCGAGREAVLAPAASASGDGTVQIKCVSTSPPRERGLSATPPAPATVSVVAPPRQASSDTVRVGERTSRSGKDTALIIGGAAGAGAGIGAIAKGKKGAAVGAAIGGVAGTVYDLLTRKQN